jgi:hypothetical protein
MTPGSQPWRALRRLGLALFGSCLALGAGCKAIEDFDQPERHLLATASPLPVTLSPELRGLRKRTSESGSRTVYKVGHLLRRLFSGEDGHAFLSLVGSGFQTSGGLIGPWESRYDLAVALQLGGMFHLLQVRGTGASSAGSRQAEKLAVEDSIEQMYERLLALVGPYPPVLTP